MRSRSPFPLSALVSVLALVTWLNFHPRSADADVISAPADSALYFSPVCTHDGYVIVSRYHCPAADSTSNTRVFGGSSVATVTLTTTLKDGTSFSEEIPAGTDALFLSNVAIRKFLRPYYQRIGQRQNTTQLTRFMQFIASRGRTRPSS